MSLSDSEWSSYLVRRSSTSDGPIQTGIAEVDAIEAQMFEKFRQKQR